MQFNLLSRTRVQLLAGIVASLLAGLLLVSWHEGMTSFHWSTSILSKYLDWVYPNSPRARDYHHLIYQLAFFQVWLSAIFFFLIWRVTSHFEPATKPLRVITGIIGVVGFPAIQVLSGHGRALLLEAVISLVIVILIGAGIWNISTHSAVVLGIVHFALWAWYGRNTFLPVEILLWPGWDWVSRIGRRPWGLYILLSVLTSTLWFLVTQKGPIEESHG